MRNQRSRHRPDRGDTSIRLDPYAIDDTTFTLEEYRRQQGAVRASIRRAPAAARSSKVSRRRAAA